MLVPLHLKSHYSLGIGCASIERLVERAAMLGLPAMALTDVENLYGQVLFHRLAREKGIKPITGVELQSLHRPETSSAGSAPKPDTRLVLLARNRTGYENLCQIITRRKLSDGTQDDLIDSLRNWTEGLYLLTDDPLTAERLLSVPEVGRQFTRLLLIRPGRGVTAERKVIEASSKLGIPLVADPDIVFVDPEDRPLHCLQLAIGKNLLLSQVEEQSLTDPYGRHFPGPRESEDLFADVALAIEETHHLAESCELDLGKSKPIFPKISLPPGETAYSHLAKLTFHGLERRLERRHRKWTSQHLERLARELAVIEKLGFCEYFLIVGDLVRFAHECDIGVVARGSGAGSLVAHALDITHVDPLEYGLYFERFLHEGRSDLPDIDVDLCWIRRDEVIRYVYETYGENRVAMISSHVTFQPHMAFRETLKAFGVPMEQVNRYSRRLPYVSPDARSKTPLHDLICSSPLAKTIPLEEEPFRTAIPLAERILNQPHHLSIHPGGIVIGARRLEAYTPLERAAKGIVVTQYDMHSIEDVGLVKIDLLGNRCLTEHQDTLRNLGGTLQLADIPDEDPKTIELLRSARTVGCFQLESPAMRSLIGKLPTRSIRDCIAAVALIRPGAAAGGAKEAYLRRSNGEEPPEYLHPSLRKLLEESHGVVIYEEDVMCIASAVAGVTLAEGDALRSAIKKCRSSDDMRDLENTFLLQAIRNGIQPDVASAVWKDLRKFASYCFSKAHASGYGLLAYQSAYLKAHFPVEFGCAILNNHAGMYSMRTISEEVKRMGVRLLHPSVNHSDACFSMERVADGTAVRTGFSRIKGLSCSAIERIISARNNGPFRSFSDFLLRVRIPHRSVETLILAGAFDDLPPPREKDPLNHPQLIWELENTTQRTKATDRDDSYIDIDYGVFDHPSLAAYDTMTCIRNELEILGMALTNHPMRVLRNKVQKRRCISTREAAQSPGRRVRVAGLIAASRNVRTKGGVMRFITIEDEHDLLEATLFPNVYRMFSACLNSLGPYLVEGTVENDRGTPSLNVSRVEIL
jgi:DNA-directed DNA polymerase III PolC